MLTVIRILCHPPWGLYKFLEDNDSTLDEDLSCNEGFGDEDNVEERRALVNFFLYGFLLDLSDFIAFDWISDLTFISSD